MGKTSFNWQPIAVNLQHAFPGNIASSLELQLIMKVHCSCSQQSIPKAKIMNSANLLEFYVGVQMCKVQQFRLQTGQLVHNPNIG